MKPCRALPRSFYRRPSAEVAADLLGRYLVRELDGQRLVLRIVETEAYQGEGDRASHAWHGRRTVRTRSLYRDGGHAYVYLIYGIHHCMNATTGSADDAHAVLIRAGSPVEGAEAMAERRALRRAPRAGDLAGGPGKLCQALGVDRGLDGHRLDRGALRLTAGEPFAARDVRRGPRIGVDYAGDAATWPLRFAVAGHADVSKPRLS